MQSAEDAVRKNLAYYDLFILDVMMGPISGFRLAEKIRKGDDTDNTCGLSYCQGYGK